MLLNFITLFSEVILILEGKSLLAEKSHSKWKTYYVCVIRLFNLSFTRVKNKGLFILYSFYLEILVVLTICCFFLCAQMFCSHV